MNCYFVMSRQQHDKSYYLINYNDESYYLINYIDESYYLINYTDRSYQLINYNVSLVYGVLLYIVMPPLEAVASSIAL